MGVSQPLKLKKHPLSDGGYLAQLTLNSPQKLNALDLETVQRLYQVLQSLASDPEAAAIWLEGAGSRGFCVGSDVCMLRKLALAAGLDSYGQAERFLEIQYRLGHLMHNYPKPIIAWGHGLVMGGGLGLLVAARHRIAAPDSQFSMPEIRIGLFPNLGATWYMQRMPGKSGLFCALTGVPLNAGDALYSGLADYLLPGHARRVLLSQLLELDWQFDVDADNELVTAELTELEAQYDECLPGSHLNLRSDLIETLCEDTRPEAIDKAFQGLHGDDAWLNVAGQHFAKGAASSACIVLEQYRRGEALSLADAFRLELDIAVTRFKDAEFLEGVRAQLVDKDRNPAWRYPRLVDVPDTEISRLFAHPWAEHPLADLV